VAPVGRRLLTGRPAVHAIATQLVVRRPARLAYAVLAVALLACAVVVIVVLGASWWQAAAFGLAPDLAVLYGIARGQLHLRAVRLHNAVHRFWGPLALALVAIVAGLPLGYLAGALGWAVHVAFDRAIGLRLRSPDGFQRDPA
jgi:Domain of unknown function (DUF4260)